ncbi:MAG TPA: MBL fold metallo-hydrolase [Candidatus Krumholzibacteria bacterium]|nr:MBL fold metallo-hydrolase [Candidatus Krumholzibacteria bacterium]
MPDRFAVPGTDWTLERITVGPLLMNAYLLSSAGAGEALLIDPGDEPERLLAAVDATGCRLTGLLSTHGHFDHISAASAIQAAADLPLRHHPDETALVSHLNATRAAYGFPPAVPPRTAADLTTAVPFAGGVIGVTHVPGHSPGHVMLTLPGHALVGDVIFYDSIGRTDLPGGSYEVLEASILNEVYVLDDATVLHPGHGPETTVAREAAENPFVRR